MAKAYKMTAARRAALRKAQLASARKRKGKKNPKLAAAHKRARRNVKIGLAFQAGVAVAAGATAYYWMRKTASGGPKIKAQSSSPTSQQLDSALRRAGRNLARKGTYGRRTVRRSRTGRTRDRNTGRMAYRGSALAAMSMWRDPLTRWQL